MHRSNAVPREPTGMCRAAAAPHSITFPAPSTSCEIIYENLTKLKLNEHVSQE